MNALARAFGERRMDLAALYLIAGALAAARHERSATITRRRPAPPTRRQTTRKAGSGRRTRPDLLRERSRTKETEGDIDA